MFTGIVEEVGALKAVRRGMRSAALVIEGRIIFDQLAIGDSVAVNGVCLTVTSRTSNTFSADVMHETLSRSGLGALMPGAAVNLERAMAANGRFGGHIVSGHIDGTGKLRSIHTEDNAVWYTIAAQKEILRLIVEKGSITVDGISLTVAAVTASDFSVSAIPHTVRATVLANKRVGDDVNLENDIVGKYIEKLLTAAPQMQKNGITKELLARF